MGKTVRFQPGCSFTATSIETPTRKKRLRLILSFLLLLVSTVHGFAQQSHITPRHKPPPPPKKQLTFPTYHKYKVKDTIPKLNPYLSDTLYQPIPMGRMLFHDNIDKEQKKADLADSKEDRTAAYGSDSTLTDLLSSALFQKVDSIQVMIENMPANGREPLADNQQKISYLRTVWELMRRYNSDTKPDAGYYTKLIANMHDMLIAANENTMMPFVTTNVNIYTLDNIKAFSDKFPDARAFIYRKMGIANPVMMIKRLSEYAADTFAQAIIKADARIEPEVIFSYAQSTNLPLKSAVYNTKDKLVQSIVQIAAHSKAPLKAFPFLGDLYSGRKTIEEIDFITQHIDLYFNNLVRLRMEHDTIAPHAFNAELQYRALNDFIRQMNGLHEEKDDVRFKCIDSLPATSLYYIMVYGQDEIYTSSFLGTFKRMIERMKPMKGDQLLDTLHYDHFRTFIRMCAGYNTLSDFLATADDTSRTKLMTSFIAGLEQGKADDLEDAVDVANAFGSIRDSALSVFLEKKVKENYEQSYKDGSKKGMIIYSLLAMLFESNKISGSDTGASVASSRLHLPPINKVPYKNLVSDSGIVYQQVFFFGDKDGQDSYDSYIREFKNDNKWNITTEKLWTVISSRVGKRVVIYANQPLKEPDDEYAQDSLSRFLDSSGIHPTIMIHRGHSYHLKATIAKLTKGVKIVILGSCGGYQNLSMVLERAPDAHIISSKQTGVMAVNEPIIKALNTRLLEGEDINWITLWKELEDFLAKKPDALEKFADYVPPYKNLGAIFIKAYRMMDDAHIEAKQ
jgi:hypothetical protein